MITQDGKAGIRVYFCRNAAHPTEVTSSLTKLGLRNDVAVEAVPCTGRIDSRYLLKAFEGGAHAVCVMGCPSGECRLMEGNLRATRRVEAVRELLAEAGLDASAVQIFLADSSSDKKLDGMMEAVELAANESRDLQGMVA